MQRIWMLAVLIIFSSLAKSQDSTDYTLNNIKKYGSHIAASFSTISSNIERDKQQLLAPQAENIKVYIDSIEEEMEYLPDEYYYHLSPFVSAYRTDIDEFEKLVLNQDFTDKEKFLAKSFTSLQQRQSEFRKALDLAYTAAVHQQPMPEDMPRNETANEHTAPVAEQHNTDKDTTTVNGNNVILVEEAVSPSEITTSSNALLLDTIHGAQQQVEYSISNIHLSMKKNNFGEVGADANSIAKAALKISDLALLLKTDQKQSLYILATGLKNLSETLHGLALKGISADDEMQECIDKIKIKFSTLSTGISLVQ